MDGKEKIVKGIEIHEKKHCLECPYVEAEGGTDTWCLRGLHRDMLAMLKAQEPVKPVLDIDTWKCGNCGHTLEHQELLGDNVLFHEQYNYCPGCGRKVKFDG